MVYKKILLSITMKSFFMQKIKVYKNILIAYSLVSDIK